ncbi:MAG: hypothetical protein RhofKO_18410 [Rhodothermales bacterium]
MVLERFCDVVDTSYVETTHLVGGVVECCQEDDRDVLHSLVPLEAFANLEAIDSVNAKYGRGTVHLGRVQPRQQRMWALNHAKQSP